MSGMKFRITLLLTFFSVALFVACEKDVNQDLIDEATAEEIDLRDDVEEPHGGPDGALGRPGCVRLIFPLTVDFPDGTSAEAATPQALRELLGEWKDDNPGAEERPRIAFPHDIELPDGAVVTVSEPVQLRRFIRRCLGRPALYFPQPCFQLIFPVKVVFPDGSTFEAATRYALAVFVREWREAHPDLEGRPELVMPYQVRLRDGTLATIAEEGDLAQIAGDCRDERPAPPSELCFKLVYPVTLVFPSGRSASAGSHEEMLILLETWRRLNPNATGRPTIAFPQEIEIDGEVIEVASREELEEIIGDCWEDLPFDLPCFRLVFPLTVNFPDGSSKTIENRYQLGRYLRKWHQQRPSTDARPELDFPLQIQFQDGSTTTVNSREELKAAREDCRD